MKEKAVSKPAGESSPSTRVKAAAGNTPQHPRRRLSPQAREREIVQGAIAFFAEHGFGGQTRELAKVLGIAQPLLYRYFPTKESLIERVYQEVFVGRLQPKFHLLADTNRTLKERLISFYHDYAHTICTYEYTRLLLLGGLKGQNFHTRLFARVREHVFPPVIQALRQEYGRPSIDETQPTTEEVETVWALHATIYYLGVRRHVFDLVVPDIDETVTTKVETFLNGATVILASRK